MHRESESVVLKDGGERFLSNNTNKIELLGCKLDRYHSSRKTLSDWSLDSSYTAYFGNVNTHLLTTWSHKNIKVTAHVLLAFSKFPGAQEEEAKDTGRSTEKDSPFWYWHEGNCTLSLPLLPLPIPKERDKARRREAETPSSTGTSQEDQRFLIFLELELKRSSVFGNQNNIAEL